ncbi:alpha/beta hydrolase [uncultured Gimesia sp.]|uniref:alpha/beta hydrolase n=1 Tax=uncultured Gimesia sp. TaxID=1678688 RepID=UPI00260FA117|nr:alpha/beta hydrolase [uncultured Gimesia sp.]
MSCPFESSAAETFRRITDIEYAAVDNHRLLLDLYIPEAQTNPQLLVWVHGGAWRAGSKSNMPLIPLVNQGYAVASVEYRLSPVAKFPAQIHDIKAAIRFLRGSASKYGYHADKIGILGSSAGGHLVALMGVTNHHRELEGDLGEFDQESSAVDAIVDYYGPTNFMTILNQSTPHGLSVRVPALQLLLGTRPEENTALAKLASPVFHVDARDPPLLMIHGDQDPQVPINQSHELHGAYKKQNLDVTFEVIHGGAHGGPEFFDEKRIKLVELFLRKHLSSNTE